MNKEYQYRALLVGNPNCGKSAIFNALTGSHQRLGNWAGVTVEMKEGIFTYEGKSYQVVDLPGIYSVNAESEDEEVACQALFSLDYDLIINVLDASNLERNLYLTTQLIEMRKPMIFVLNMIDVAQDLGIFVDVDLLSEQLASHLESHISKGEISVSHLKEHDLDLEDLVSGLKQYHIDDDLVATYIDGHLADHPSGKIDGRLLEQHLGAPLLAMSAVQKGSGEKLREVIANSLESRKISAMTIPYAPILEEEIARLQVNVGKTAEALRISRRYVAIKLLEGDHIVLKEALSQGEVTREVLELKRNVIKENLRMTARTAIIEGRYGVVHGIIERVTRLPNKEKRTRTDKIDDVVLHRFLGIPIFMAMMYLLFWFVMKVGAAFQDFFDIAFGTIFVEIPDLVMSRLGVPDWLIALLAHGVGAGLQAVSTFVPIVFVMFLGISLLEDLGYMARAAFLMDKSLRKIGLPGKAFVPLIVGFGCTVPAMMATRTLSSKRDRMITMFMAPMMSCSARLPVYALFGAIFFPEQSALMIFSLYIIGIIIALLIGLVLHRSLPFNKHEQYFVMELPPYHRPQIRLLLKHTWMRTKGFVFKAGKYLVIAVTIIGVFNTINLRGEIVEDPNDSITAFLGKAVTPVFMPFGVEQENWPASVGLLTGIVAKEAVIGTISAIYSHNEFLQKDEEGDAEEDASVWQTLVGGLSEAVVTTWENILGIFSLELLSADSGEDEDSEARLTRNLLSAFNLGKWQVYAYLLFVLIYVPCVAVIATAYRELGSLLGMIMITYLTVLAWAVAVLFYQVVIGGSMLWMSVSLVILAGLVAFFFFLGSKLLEKYIVK
ncbi:ferrous iron transport protein B [Entomospira culicis]|uniref:Ferrous iron transport protein B n=1 Tax=Entomospira culicis TaxID=2719989 RepID=A0A968GJ49_9SPIO|nr:ferrous iron transport protein B [Entomospira culicis]NIZ19465.1 ferrous iron transport protein B [Entomospira culicis]NIZ69630.1 ferrous iron transport protein B [Entomospira culicis]WDI36741.1 ferrous iron transport protein B [Entomospira culicis]WDI38370.1 ferrous iron transport protein B [Entomospira culicis]